ncbi:MAG: ABC transporter ATP-binding protein [Acidiferrobacteraceae bacterium]|jgi:branched-chain amino acid transport system ATP-binding protein|nr:ABC transporter ATP-binding protein [Acidiferrobacteraceae bacterium]MDP6434149.1 ABC transporter ATP-binding protein [Arenicellales bacterium]MDP6673094.1 ABC transporter ATP-binding protein [Arenicellales bacterium]MDP6725076.1 ABC transporter ATP-binding protein [Arenicellales bacterium]|tara:strand:- start:7503 stop:8222 length:720 start_codon:yes stop_codon:yes gene_type:complete
MSNPLLRVDNLQAFYDQSHILQGVSLSVNSGEVLSVLGRNGAGKTTLLNSIMAILHKRTGSIIYGDQEINKLPPYKIAKQGIAYVPEIRGIFPSLTVRENLEIASRRGREGASQQQWTLDSVYSLFPHLRERAQSGGGKLSGGEQQMLSIARALMTNPDLLILDEPTEGLAPLVVKEIEELLTALKRQGLTMLMVEQNLGFATRLSDQIVVLGKGRIRWSGTPELFSSESGIQRTWLGV